MSYSNTLTAISTSFETVKQIYGIEQGYTNYLRQVAWESKFCTVAPNVCGVFIMEAVSYHPSGT